MPNQKKMVCQVDNCNLAVTYPKDHCLRIHDMNEFIYAFYRTLSIFFHFNFTIDRTDSHIIFKNAETTEIILNVKKPETSDSISSEDEEPRQDTIFNIPRYETSDSSSSEDEEAKQDTIFNNPRYQSGYLSGSPISSSGFAISSPKSTVNLNFYNLTIDPLDLPSTSTNPPVIVMMQIETSKSFKSGNKECMLCMSAYEDDIQYGEMKTLDDITVHYFCLLMASHIEQRGNDDEGILGFLPNDIRKIINKGKKFKCIYCKLMGATVHCIMRKCQNVFHLICGLEKGTLHQYFGQFKSYCHQHRPKQKVPSKYFKNDAKCLICLNSVYGFVSNDSLWPPCCKNTWFHRICVQKLALSTGYFFKCPLCNNIDIFVEAMKRQGIYIPSRDASWELEENAYSDLLFSYSRCDAVTCYCPKGRTYSSNNNDNGSWDLLLCVTCGSQGCHRKCSNILVDNQWECLECKEITQYVKSTAKKKKKKRNYKKYKKVKLNDKDIESSSSSLSDSNLSENTSNNNLFETENENENKYEDKENNENQNISLSLPKITISIKEFLQSHSISQKLISIDCSDSEDDFDIFEILKSEINYLKLNFGFFEEQELNSLEQHKSENVICNERLNNLSIQNNNEQKKTEQISPNNTFLCPPQNILHEMCESIIINGNNSLTSPNKTTYQNNEKFIVKSKIIQNLKDNNEESEIISNSDFNRTSVDLNDDVEIIEIIKKPRIVEVIDILDDESNESVNKYDMTEIIEVADNGDFEREIFNVDEDLIEID